MAKRPPATEVESIYMGLVARLPCVLCELLEQPQNGKTDVHHTREEQGGGQRGRNLNVSALCHFSCHQGPKGLHGDKSRLRIAKVDEMDLQAITTEKILRQLQLLKGALL